MAELDWRRAIVARLLAAVDTWPIQLVSAVKGVAMNHLVDGDRRNHGRTMRVLERRRLRIVDSDDDDDDDDEADAR